MIENSILCVSWCDADYVLNYGQILQACAMMQILRSNTNGNISYISYFPNQRREALKIFLKHFDFRKNYCFTYWKTRHEIRKIIKKNSIHFKQIRRHKCLDRYAEGIDIMFCGSDQLWHPTNYDRAYYLKFGNQDIIRVSYAASMPKTKREPMFEEQYCKISDDIKSIDFISVRECGSINLVSSLSGQRVISVLDPTYLVKKEMWENMCSVIATPERYIFVYVPNGMDEKLVQIVNYIKDKLQAYELMILGTRGDNLFPDSDTIDFVSVGQFLYLIKNASYVITSSFHATVFSTIFHRNFWCYDVPNDSRGEDIRLNDLLGKLQLSNRCVSDLVNINLSDIDFNLIDLCLSDEIKESNAFLEAAFR